MIVHFGHNSFNPTPLASSTNSKPIANLTRKSNCTNNLLSSVSPWFTYVCIESCSDSHAPWLQNSTKAQHSPLKEAQETPNTGLWSLQEMARGRQLFRIPVSQLLTGEDLKSKLYIIPSSQVFSLVKRLNLCCVSSCLKIYLKNNLWVP